MDEAIRDVWTEALRVAHMHAKGSRAAELRGDRRVKTFDPRGLHLYSAEWGRVMACESLIPALTDLRDTGEFKLDPVSMRARAYREAEDEFEADARKGQIDWHRG